MKRCNICLVDKDIKEFYNSTPYTCKICHCERSRAYSKTPTRRAKMNKYQRDRVRYHKSITDNAKSVPCADCGILYPPYVMDFDHVRGEKKFNIASGIKTSSTQSILDEIAKCDIVCANCHRIRTHEGRNNALQRSGPKARRRKSQPSPEEIR